MLGVGKRLKPTDLRVDLRGRVFRYLLLIAAAAGIAMYFLVLRPDMGKTEETLGALASQIAGRPVSVKCQGVIKEAVDVSAAEGEVLFENGEPTDVAELKRGICIELADFPKTLEDERYRCLASSDACPKEIIKRVVAVHTLTHEAWHLRGVQDERVTECYAMQTSEIVARRLGASQALARAMAVYYANERYTRLSSSYQSPFCRDGSRYDLNRGSRVWP